MPSGRSVRTPPSARAVVAVAAVCSLQGVVRTGAAQRAGVEPLALSGQTLPQLGQDATILGFDPSVGVGLPGLGYGVRLVLSESGAVAASVLLNEPYGAGTQRTGILLITPDAFETPALPGGTPPGVAAGLTYWDALPVWLDDQGRLSWEGELQGPGVVTSETTLGFVSDESAVWLPDDAGGVRVVREGVRVPGHPANVRLQDPELVVVNGRALLRGLVGDRLNIDLLQDQRYDQNWSVHRIRSAGLGPVLAANDGINDSAYGDIADGFFSINGVDADDTIYVSALDQPPLRFVLWLGGSAAAPLGGVTYEGVGAGGAFIEAGSMLILEDGVRAFSAVASFEDGNDAQGVWLREGGDHYRLLARSLDPIPGLDEEQRFTSMWPVAVAPDGLVVLAGRVEPDESAAVWFWDRDEGFTEVLREGTSPEWLPAGADSIEAVRGWSFGASGEVHARVELQGEGLTVDTRMARIVIGRFGSVRLLSRGGATFEVGAGDSRIVSMSAISSPRAERVNAGGQVAFWQEFEDGSEGVFLGDIREIARCGSADLAPPEGTLNFDDVLAFIGAFGEGQRRADLAAPLGEIDFADILAFLGAFGSCP